MDNDRIFIPLSLERINPEGSSYFFSPMKGVILAMAIIPGVIYIPLVASTTQGSITGFILGFATYLFVLHFVLRFAIFEELKWKRLFGELQQNKLSTYNYFWGIDRIDSSGVIHYKYSGGTSLRKAVVIKLIRASKIGREDSYEDNYREVFRQALREILRKGISVDVYETLDIKSVPQSILAMNKKALKLEDSVTRKIALEHVKNLALISKTSKKIEVKYLTLYFDNPRQFKDILDYAEDIMYIFEGSKYFKIVKVLDREDVEKFIAQELNINTLPADEGRSDVPNFNMYGEVVRIFNEEGDEEWVEGTIATKEITYKDNSRLDKLSKKKYTEEDVEYEEFVETLEEESEKLVDKSTKKTERIKKINSGKKGILGSIRKSIQEANDEDYVDLRSGDIYKFDDDYVENHNKAANINSYRDDYVDEEELEPEVEEIETEVEEVETEEINDYDKEEVIKEEVNEENKVKLKKDEIIDIDSLYSNEDEEADSDSDELIDIDLL